jgi:phosphoesterase RecJ-like protein
MKKTTATLLPPTDLGILDQIVSALKEGESFCLSGHQNPDGDVIGSELAMAYVIRQLGANKRVDIQNNGPVPKSVSFLPGVENIKNVERVNEEYDVVIVFECSGADRMGGIIDLKTQAKKVINIDHHLHNPNFGHINFVEPHTSSTCELIFKISQHAKIPLTQDAAVCLYTGLVTDTGWFHYGNTNTQTHQIAAQLVGAGVPVALLAEKIYLSRSTVYLKLLSWVLGHMKLYYDDRVALLKIPQETFRQLGATPDDLEEVVNYGLQIESVCASLLLKEKTNPSVIKVSLRSKELYDINQVARVFGGGGHRNASGCSLSMNLDEAEKTLVKEMSRVFENQS